MNETEGQAAHGQAQAAQEDRVKERLSHIRHKLLVVSGKGGVGKTTVAVNLAYALARSGKKTGILDIDFHGPNVAKMLGIEGRPLSGDESSIDPVTVIPNLTAVSLALAHPHPDDPVVWRGPLKMAAIRQFLGDVNWGDLDYLVIDSPPGTGDEPLSAAQLIPDLSGLVIVTTPQDVAVLDSRKCVKFAKLLNVPALGIIENMSGLVCPHCSGTIDLFKRGGGERSARELGVPFLGSIPIEPGLVEMADSGTPFVQAAAGSASAEAFEKIVEKIQELILR